MKILKQVPLDSFNTLALPARAEFFCAPDSPDELREALAHARANDLEVTVLGGGSNVVLAGDLPGLVIHMKLRGSQVVHRDGDRVQLRVAAGENWPDLVSHSLHRGWYGLENLSLIPGSAGAAPIQNIGAYGVELRERLVEVEMLDIATGEQLLLDNDACEFGYRDSIFKHRLRGRVVITAVTLELSLRPAPCLDYPELRQALAAIADPSPQQVGEAVCALRRAKLPDPVSRPNAGSFFKNPVVDRETAEDLQARYPTLPAYPQPGNAHVKLPAAWLIDRAGWKGHRNGPVAVHDRQALVLVHLGGGRGADILDLADAIAGDVRQKFGIALELEPTVLGHAQPGR